MITVTIGEAKARLNRLVDMALKGEQVVFLRGSRHVATLVPISAEDLELAPRLGDAQAARLWQEIARERKEGRVREFATPEDAIRFLNGRKGRRTR